MGYNAYGQWVDEPTDYTSTFDSTPDYGPYAADPTFADQLGYTYNSDGSVNYGDIHISADGTVSDPSGTYSFTVDQLEQNPSLINQIFSKSNIPALSGLATAGLGALNSNNLVNASQSGLNAATNTMNSALGQQNAITQQQLANFAPYQQWGLGGMKEMDQFSNPNYSFLGSPSGAFQFNEGNKMLNRSLANRGLLGSGQAAMAKSDLASKVAANDYETAYNRALNKVKIGTGAAGSANSALGAQSNNIGSTMGTIGGLQNTAANAQGTARTGLYQGAINGLQIGTAMSDWMNK